MENISEKEVDNKMDAFFKWRYKTEVIFSVIIIVIGLIVLKIMQPSMFQMIVSGISFKYIASIVSFLVVIGVIGYYLERRYSPEREVIKGNQRVIKQYIWIESIIAIVSIISIFVLLIIKSEDYLAEVFGFLGTFFLSIISLFYSLRSLKECQNKDGKDTTPILNTFERWFLIIVIALIILVLGIIYL